ncbi:MAG: hypothetical protein GF350_03840 [Chitinivibrionales bacterium]|nr:hypothetical protein [Chitinivibrionales bacterium]
MSTREKIQWLGMELEVPDDWEIVRHSTGLSKGRLIFIDRRFQRLQFAWTACEKRPAETRIVGDFRARDKEEDQSCTISDVYRIGGWRVYTRRNDATIITRAGLYDPRCKRWLDCVFSWPNGREKTIEENVLTSYSSQNPGASIMHWRAFGLDMDIPAIWKIRKAEVFPGATKFVYEQNNCSLTIRRRAMAPYYYCGSVEEYLAGKTAGNTSVYRGTHNGHHAACARAKERFFRPRWLKGKRKVTRECTWFCDSKETFFHITASSFISRPADFKNVVVRCCN